MFRNKNKDATEKLVRINLAARVSAIAVWVILIIIAYDSTPFIVTTEDIETHNVQKYSKITNEDFEYDYTTPF